ncbi:MAG TPA: DUF547 domain-containing protein [Vicinamibacterales bacterium]|nr:DUF547 domain-containing protein [Vicinamibacterales bacterium]
MARITSLIITLAILGLGAAVRSEQAPVPTTDPLHRPLDQLLDVNVRDGLVYYRALQSSRGALDRYVASLNVPAATYEGWSRDAKVAFWVNAYNAAVLQTVVNRYPIRGSSPAFPPSSIRQISGAFDQAKHRFAGRSVTLDEIDKSILPEFKDPRLTLALGRGALGSGRLRSEAFTAAKLAAQLDDIANEFVSDRHMLQVDRTAGQVSTSPILSWHEAEFVAAYDKDVGPPFASRSPIERALIAFVLPRLLPLEKEFVQKNDFKVTFHSFDWRLNDLSGGRIDAVNRVAPGVAPSLLHWTAGSDQPHGSRTR